MRIVARIVRDYTNTDTIWRFFPSWRDMCMKHLDRQDVGVRTTDLDKSHNRASDEAVPHR